MAEDAALPDPHPNFLIASDALRRSWCAIYHDVNDFSSRKILPSRKVGESVKAIDGFVRAFSTKPVFSHDAGKIAQDVVLVRWQNLCAAVESHAFRDRFAPHAEYFQAYASHLATKEDVQEDAGVPRDAIANFARTLSCFTENLPPISQAPVEPGATSATVAAAFESLQFAIGLVTRHIQNLGEVLEQRAADAGKFGDSERAFASLLDDVTLFGRYLSLRLLLKTAMGTLAEFVLRLLLVIHAQKRQERVRGPASPA
jgi:hypothetical protein